MKRMLMSGLVVLAASSVANAAVVTLDFEGLANGEAILDFYNGGTGSLGNSGVNYGISFGVDSLGLIDADDGGSGNFANEPSSKTIAFFVAGPGVIMDVASGFTTGFSFWYTSVGFSGSVDVYDGLGGTGTLLASLALPALGSAGTGDPTGTFDTWDAVGVLFAGTAKSVNFSGAGAQIGFDNITLGSQTPGGVVPLPGAAWMGLSMLGGLAVLRRRRKTLA